MCHLGDEACTANCTWTGIRKGRRISVYRLTDCLRRFPLNGLSGASISWACSIFHSSLFPFLFLPLQISTTARFTPLANLPASFSSLMGRSLIYIISIGEIVNLDSTIRVSTYLIIGSWRMKVKENLSLLIFLKVIDRRIKSRDERDNFSPIYSQLRSRRIRIGWHASIRRFPI